MALVSVGFQESVGTISMQHAERRNALSEALVGEIIAALEDFDHQKARAVVLRAARGSRVWSAGHDVRELPLTRRDPLGWSDPLRTLVRALQELPAPVHRDDRGWGLGRGLRGGARLRHRRGCAERHLRDHPGQKSASPTTPPVC